MAKYMGNSVTINKVENGFTLILSSWDSSIVLVAKTKEELIDLLTRIEWQDNVRNNGAKQGRVIPTAEAQSAGGFYGS